MVLSRPVWASPVAAPTASAVLSPATNRRTTSRLTGAFSIRLRTWPLLESCNSPWRSTALASTTCFLRQ